MRDCSQVRPKPVTRYTPVWTFWSFPFASRRANPLEEAPPGEHLLPAKDTELGSGDHRAFDVEGSTIYPGFHGAMES